MPGVAIQSKPHRTEKLDRPCHLRIIQIRANWYANEPVICTKGTPPRPKVDSCTFEIPPRRYLYEHHRAATFVGPDGHYRAVGGENVFRSPRPRRNRRHVAADPSRQQKQSTASWYWFCKAGGFRDEHASQLAELLSALNLSINDVSKLSKSRLSGMGLQEEDAGRVLAWARQAREMKRKHQQQQRQQQQQQRGAQAYVTVSDFEQSSDCETIYSDDSQLHPSGRFYVTPVSPPPPQKAWSPRNHPRQIAQDPSRSEPDPYVAQRQGPPKSPPGKENANGGRRRRKNPNAQQPTMHHSGQPVHVSVHPKPQAYRRNRDKRHTKTQNKVVQAIPVSA
eukprot:Colp12_sorted_trinity150504_noHs@26253